MNENALLCPCPSRSFNLRKDFPDLAIGRRAVDRNQTANGMRAELFRKGDFLFCRKLRGCKIGRAEPLDQLRGKEFHQGTAIGRRRRDDLHQRRPAP